MGIDVQITLNVITCGCGACYAVPHWVGTLYYVCPFCSQRKQQELKKEIDSLQAEISHHNYVNNGLRGALKKRRKIEMKSTRKEG